MMDVLVHLLTLVCVLNKLKMIEILEITVCIAALIWAGYTLFSSVYSCSNPNKCNKNCKCYE